MTFGILIFPGAHGDRDLTSVLEDHYGKKVVAVGNKETNLSGIDVLMIPGGFPCKGSSNSSRCIKNSPVIDSMLEFADRGKIVIGIGNGFRVLCETELIPGTMRMNKSQRFVCRNAFIKPDNNSTALTRKLSSDLAYQIPVATGYGRYAAKEDVLVGMRLNNQILFRYCDEFAVISEENNATGSVNNIAGICNERKNVFGLVPQPERAVFSYGHNTDGRALFDSLMESF
jgi:phosphoribosylformylglycinamidine synthase subunit PurQ / glutaminase